MQGELFAVVVGDRFVDGVERFELSQKRIWYDRSVFTGCGDDQGEFEVTVYCRDQNTLMPFADNGVDLPIPDTGYLSTILEHKST